MTAHLASHTNMTLAAADADRRAMLFRESPLAMVERWALGTAWAFSPKRIGSVPAIARLCLAEFLSPDYALPDPERALANPAGLAGIAHDLSPQTLIAAYRRGLYPLAHIGPQKWWSPPARTVLLLDQTHIGKNLRRELRRGHYTVTFDRDFDAVIAACAERRNGRWHLTWITPRVMHAFARLFDLGVAHSFEVWNQNGELAGGGYGVALGGVFITELQFSRERNTSKIGFAALNFHLARWGFAFNDGKLMTPALNDVGFREIARSDFLARLAQAQKLTGQGNRWQMETDLAAIADWHPAG